jgi:hypothetical protein
LSTGPTTILRETASAIFISISDFSRRSILDSYGYAPCNKKKTRAAVWPTSFKQIVAPAFVCLQTGFASTLIFMERTTRYA